MLTLLEEIVLLTIDERSGKLRSPAGSATGYALAGALFFDLALAGRIDTGTENIQVIDTTPTGKAVTDYFLAALAQRSEKTTVRDWMEEAFRERDYLEQQAIASLVERGILRHETTKMLWVIDVERFPIVNHQPQHHVQLRLAQTILTDTIPDTRDIMLLSLAKACRLLPYILSEEEIESRSQRIATVCQLETISREVTEAIAFVEQRSKLAMNQPF